MGEAALAINFARPQHLRSDAVRVHRSCVALAWREKRCLHSDISQVVTLLASLEILLELAVELAHGLFGNPINYILLLLEIEWRFTQTKLTKFGCQLLICKDHFFKGSIGLFCPAVFQAYFRYRFVSLL